MKALFKLGIASTIVLIALIAICGLVASLSVGTPDVATAPGTPAPVLPAPSMPAEPDPESVAASSEAESVTPPEAATEPAAVTPPRPELEPEKVDLRRFRNATLMEAVIACREKKRSPEQLLATAARNLRVGRVVYMPEAATVISVLTDAIQLSLADDTTAFLVGANYDSLVSGNTITPKLVQVMDTAAYQTVLGGSRSGWVLRRVSDSEWAEAESSYDHMMGIARRNDMRDELVKLEAALANPKRDTFVSADGKHTTEASVIGFADGKVSMVKADGKEVSVPLDRLDNRSQDIAKTRIGTRSRAKTRIAHIQKELAADE